MIQRLLMLVLALTLAGPVYSQKKKPPETVSLVYDITAQKSLYEERGDRLISIASMTKLISVMAVLNAGQDLSEQITVVRSKDSSPRIRAGMRIARLDLISLAMVSSDNLATRTLIEHYPGGYKQGILAMNELAHRLGAVNTTLVEPTGIMAANISTAEDLAQIARVAALNPLFAVLANQNQARVSVERTNRARQIVEWIVGRSTNPFLDHPEDIQLLVAKTGFTSAAGFCFIMVLEYRQHRYVLLTAGHPNKQARRQKVDSLVQEITRNSYRVKIDDRADTNDEKVQIEP